MEISQTSKIKAALYVCSGAIVLVTLSIAYAVIGYFLEWPYLLQSLFIALLGGTYIQHKKGRIESRSYAEHGRSIKARE